MSKSNQTKDVTAHIYSNGESEMHTILVVAFEGPRLSLTSMDEHLQAASNQVFPPWAHGRVKRVLLFNFNQFTYNRKSQVSWWC